VTDHIVLDNLMHGMDWCPLLSKCFDAMAFQGRWPVLTGCPVESVCINLEFSCANCVGGMKSLEFPCKNDFATLTTAGDFARRAQSVSHQYVSLKLHRDAVQH
jgi:hypothetical protein